MSDHSELIARLETPYGVGYQKQLQDEAAAALREQAGEIERLKAELVVVREIRALALAKLAVFEAGAK